MSNDRNIKKSNWTNRILRGSFKIKSLYFILSLLVVLLVSILSTIYMISVVDQRLSLVETESEVATKPSVVLEESSKTNDKDQDDMLLYLIEEEKLAHDVYKVFYDTYGAQVFGNILSSESTHQDAVLTLLKARNLDDPRSDQIGVFNNSDLQSLYNQLIAQGKQSAEEAYKVGALIEEKDIADITKQLATATDSDVVNTLDRLRKGSENHLRAFNRQINKY